MNILITGVHGFVGSNLVKALAPNHTIYGIDMNHLKELGLEYEPIRNGYRLSVPDTKTATDLISVIMGVYAPKERTILFAAIASLCASTVPP